MYEKFGFLIHLLHQEMSLNFFFFEAFLYQKFISKVVFSSDVWSQQWMNSCMVLGKFLGSKNHWEEKKILNFFCFKKCLLKGRFVNFLHQKIMTKYGIVSTYSLTFPSLKILVCLQCNLALASANQTLYKSLVFPSIQINLIISLTLFILFCFFYSSDYI